MYKIEELLDLSHTIAAPLFEGKEYPWEVLDDIKSFILALGPTLPKDEFEQVSEGIWIAREILRQWNREDKNRGRHYNHSTFIDLVMTGICGICPDMGDSLRIHPLGTCLDSFRVSGVHYHGHVLDIEWNKRSGLKVAVDGKIAGACAADGNVDVTVQL